MQSSDVEPDLVTLNTFIRSWESFGSTFLVATANASMGFATKCQDRSDSAWMRTVVGLQHSWGQRCLAELSFFGWLIEFFK